jgi:hypothetical protein
MSKTLMGSTAGTQPLHCGKVRAGLFSQSDMGVPEEPMSYVPERWFKEGYRTHRQKDNFT